MSLSHSTEHMIADDMVSNEAKWNKYYYNNFGMNRLERAKRKRKSGHKSKSGCQSSAKRIWPRCQSLDKNVYRCYSGRPHQFSALQSDTSV